ncbi:MAG: hypothetical protein ABFS86_12790 [Planctomycetota bacterium]
MRYAALAAALIAGIALGFVAGRSTAPEPENAPDGPPPVDTPPPDPRPDPEPPAPAPLELSDLLRKEVGGEVAESRVEEARRFAEFVRRRARASADAADRTAAHVVAEAIRKEREALEDAKRGGTMALLRSVGEKRIHLTELVSDRDRFAVHFARKTKGSAIDGRSLWKNRPDLPDGAVIEFPPGRWSLRTSLLDHADRFTADLLLKGAGRDETVLVLDELSTNHAIRNLTFEDLTIDCNDDYLTDLRDDSSAVFRMVRCRVIGFDTVMLAASNAAFLAEDTSFEGGFGRSPGSGNLFRVSGALLARLERCTFFGPLSSVFDSGSSATYVFDGCRFAGFPESFERTMRRSPSGVTFVGCTRKDETAEAAFDRRFSVMTLGIEAAAAPGVTISGPDDRLASGATQAATVVFGAGVFSWSGSRSVPGLRGALTIVGAGMDQTLVRPSGLPRVRTAVYRDLTLDLGRDDITVPDGGALTMTRCRVIGFDSGAGGSNAFSMDDGLFTATDCRFETGFGRNPEHGNLIRGRDSLVLELVRCYVRLPDGTFISPGRRTLASFSNCVFADADPKYQAWLGKSSANIRFLACAVSHGPVLDAKARKRLKRIGPRPFSDLNPAWGKGNAR